MLGLQETNGRREHNVGLGAFRLAGDIFESWMNSSGHRANILNGEFEEIGVGAASETPKGYGCATMWIADFGAR